MTEEDRQKQIINLDKAVQNLKDNQRLVMGCLTSDTGNGLTNKDLKVVRWAYNQKFKMLQHEKQVLSKKN